MLHQHLTTEELASLFGVAGASRQVAASVFEGSRETHQFSDSSVSADDELPAEQRVLLHAVHERFARRLTLAWSALVRAPLDVRLIDLGCMSPVEFLEQRESPGCAIALRSSESDAPIVVHLPVSMLHLMIERMLGGDSGNQPLVPAPLTEIEQRLVGRIYDTLIGELRQAWGQVWAGELSVERVAERPGLDTNLALHAPVVSFRFELALGTIQGTLDLCFPSCLLQPILTQSVAETAAGPEMSDGTKKQPESHSDVDLIDVVLALQETKIHPQDLMDLDVGDLLVTDQDVTTALQVYVAGTRVIGGIPGAIQGRKTLQVTAVSEVPALSAETGAEDAAG
ncbi:MAG: flagellar motor switch protein FliM [Planctomycetota bacterium]|nr:flagellar motor switch protein FliM [Planctomycetota bacterium]